MKNSDKYIFRGKCIIAFSAIIIFISVALNVYTEYVLSNEEYSLSYEYVNIKDMAAPKVTKKKSTTASILTELANPIEVKKEAEPVKLPATTNASSTVQNRQIWYLPTDRGRITQYPSYYHVAYDITSPDGSNANIYPVANGRISNIYYDRAGAKIVTVNHYINGVNYSSQYVHLSSFASNIYIGKEVTINDSLGKMGTTGNSTGIHLHLAVVDCAMFNSNDQNCRDLNGFFRYAKTRYNQGLNGLGSYRNVPAVWDSRN